MGSSWGTHGTRQEAEKSLAHPAAHKATWEGVADSLLGSPQLHPHSTPTPPASGKLPAGAGLTLQSVILQAGWGGRHWQLPSFLVANSSVTSMFAGPSGAGLIAFANTPAGAGARREPDRSLGQAGGNSPAWCKRGHWVSKQLPEPLAWPWGVSRSNARLRAQQQAVVLGQTAGLCQVLPLREAQHAPRRRVRKPEDPFACHALSLLRRLATAAPILFL